MPRMLRPLVLVLLSGILPSCSATVGLTASPGETPGFNANPFNPGGPPTLIPVTLTSSITVNSVNDFSGPVTLSTECCHEVIRDRWVSLDPAVHFVSSLSPASLTIPAKGSASSTLSITVQPASFPMVTSSGGLSTGIPFGKYLMKVVAKDQAGQTLETTNVGVRVLPRLEPAPTCRPATVQSIPLQVVVSSQVDAAEDTPRSTSLVIPIYLAGASPPGSTVWKMVITDDPYRPVTTSVVTLINNATSGQQKEISSAGCPGSGEFARALPGITSVQMILDQTQDNTLTFLQEECFTVFCNWKPIAVFPEPAFWTVFGGKKVTFTWMGK
jgi:hypothetical protein